MTKTIIAAPLSLARSAFLPALVTLIMSGCAGIDERQAAAPVINNPDKVDVILTEAVESISNSYKTLAEVSARETPPNPQPSPAAPADLSRKVTINWNGPIEGVLKELAGAVQYDVKAIGGSPSIPIMVSVSAKDAPIHGVIRDIGFQSDSKADIVVIPASRLIEIRYRSAR